jgi:hypothetical protein
MPLYEEARLAALAEPAAVGAQWEPDAVLHLSEAQVDAILTEVVAAKGRFDGKIEGSVFGVAVSATPDLALDGLKLGESAKCGSCVAVDAALSGDVEWSLGGRKGTVPVKAKAAFDALFAAKDESGIFSVTAVPRDLRKLDVELGNVDASVAKVLEKELGDWLRDDFFADIRRAAARGRVPSARQHDVDRDVVEVAVPREGRRRRSGHQRGVPARALPGLAARHRTGEVVRSGGRRIRGRGGSDLAEHRRERVHDGHALLAARRTRVVAGLHRHRGHRGEPPRDQARPEGRRRG